MLFKLKQYGLNNKVLSWIKCYLTNRRHRVRLNNKYSNWEKVTSGIPQGSVLGPLLFLVYINDLPKECENLSDISLFADDAKLSKLLSSNNDKIMLQQSLNRLKSWADKWLLSLNIIKCIVINIRKGCDDPNDYYIETQTGNKILQCANSTSDLGIIIDNNLNFKSHINSKIKKANSMLGIIKRNFKHLDKFTFNLLYKSLVRSHLEYASSVWHPYRKGLINELEKVQKHATKLVQNIKKLSYTERLQYLNLPTLKYRRFRGDMIETYKIINNKYDKSIVPDLEINKSNLTRGHSCKLLVQRSKHDMRKYSFTVRVSSIWNNLSEKVISSKTINNFKNNLDEHWKNQDLLYNFKSQLTNLMGVPISF